MLSASSCLSLAVLLALLCCAQAPEPSLIKIKPVGGLNDGTRCSWNCAIMDAHFLEEMKTKTAKKKVIRLVVKYEKRVNDKCVNQTSGNGSRGNVTEHWEILLLGKQLSVLKKALESVANMMSCSDPDSVDELKKIMAICTLTPVSTKSTEPTYYSGSSTNFFLYRLANLGVKLDTIDCSTQMKDNSQPCIKITKSTGNNSSTFEGLLNCSGWAEDFLFWLHVVFLLIFCYYSPTFFCLFSPTEVTEDGVHQIVLDGASPVSLESLMGNYFFSKEDTMRHRARMFILRAVVLPFPFLGLAIFGEYLQQSKEFLTAEIFGVSHILQSRMIAYCVCYNILAFYGSFCISRRCKGSPCLGCRLVKSKTLVCQKNLPKNIINHLRIQPQIITHCWGVFMRHLLNYFKTCFLLIPSVCELSAATLLLRWFLFVVLMSLSPAIIIILLMLMLLLILISIILTSPLIVLCDIPGQLSKYAYNFNIPCLRRLFSCFVFLSVGIPALLGISRLLVFAGVGMFIAFLSAFVLLLSEESLPFVACLVLVLYYIWSSYSSFTNKYQELALALFKHVKSYKISRHSQVPGLSPEIISLLENTQTTVGNKGNVIKIPQKLFYMACEELMPLRESVCVLILKVTILVSFVLLVFSSTILLNVGATPIMRTLMAFLTGFFPKIIAIYLDGGNQKKIKAIIAEEKIPEIVQKFIEGTSAANHQMNIGLDVDV